MSAPLADVLRHLALVLGELAAAADAGTIQTRDEVLTTQEAARLLNISPDHVARLASAGEIPGRKVGGQWRFSRDTILRSLDAREEAS